MSVFRYQHKGVPCLSPMRCDYCNQEMPTGYQALLGRDEKTGSNIGLFCSHRCFLDSVKDAGHDTQDRNGGHHA